MTDRLLADDAAARRAAQIEFKRPLVLEAGAGTGKTTTLVARILAWTLGRGWDEAVRGEGDAAPAHERRDDLAVRVLKGVVAITFTEAAAAEMASRVATGLAACADGRGETITGLELELLPSVDEDERAARAAALLGHLDHLEVQTIHAFCHRRVVEHPLELALHPEFRIDPELSEIEEMVRTVVEQRVVEAYAGGHSPLVAASTLGVGPYRLAEAVRHLTREGVPSTALAADPFTPRRLAKTRDELTRMLDAFLDIAGDRLDAVRRGLNARRVAKALRASRDHLERLEVDDGEAAQRLCEGLAERWPKNLPDHLGRWNRTGFNVGETAALGDRSATLRPLCAPLRRRLRHLTTLDPSALRVLREAVAPLLEETEAELRKVGLGYFPQILHEARRLFEEHPEILEAERRRIRQLLVDEFQDTDVVQCRIVSLLAFGEPAADGPGLFVVGDPKQSIYGWRNADLEAYDDFLERVEAHGGRVYSLASNFRSAPILLDEVERALRPVMRSERGLQPDFIGLLPSSVTRRKPGFGGDRWSPIEVWVSWSPSLLDSGELTTSQTEATDIEADAVARDIRSLADERGVPWKDVGVLLRATTRLEPYLDAFRRMGVPFIVTRDKQYFRRREIIEAAALVRAIVNPSDQIALLTFLRSPLVGLPDAALVPLWRRGFPRLVHDLGRDGDGLPGELESIIVDAAGEIPPNIPGLNELVGWESTLAAGLANLAMLRGAFHVDPSDVFIERLRRTTLIEASEGARFLGQYRVANLDRFFRRLSQALSASDSDVQAVLRSLRRSVTEAHEAEEALPKEAAQNAVQVMTIHKAKGLEFAHVYLVQMDADTRHSESAATDVDRRWSETEDPDYSLFGAATLSFDLVEDRRRRVAAAEQVRLLYVALTRARDRLVLAGNWREEGKRSRPGSVPTFLDLFRQRDGLPSSIIELAVRAVETDGYVDCAGLRWKFPGLARLEAPAAARESRARLPTRSAAERASRRLTKLAEVARARMERPLFGRASIAGGEPDEALERPDERTPAPPTSAQLVGRLIHQALESWDLGADIDGELDRQRRRVGARLGEHLPPSDLVSARRRAEVLFERLRSGQLLRRLVAERHNIVARELPIALPSTDEASAPVSGVVGVIDLVLRDVASAELIVVDYKTDPLDDERELAARAHQYEAQLEIYAEALRQALGLPQRPQRELWFLWPDTVWRRSRDRAGDALG